MDLQLAGKTAVVTGGSKGIGLATVRLLQDEGMRVVAASRHNTPELKETEALHVPVDLTTRDGARELVDRALAHLGGIDVLVNNVGVGDTDDIVQGMLHNILELPDESWRHNFDLHFYSALWVTRAALPSLIERAGTVVNVSSTGARLVGVGATDYNMAKAALNAFTKAISEQFGGQGVRAITVSPGPVTTGVWTEPDGVLARMAREQGVPREDLAQQFLDVLRPATGRPSTPEEVARLIAFAASPNNITGTEYLVDGGAVKAL